MEKSLFGKIRNILLTFVFIIFFILVVSQIFFKDYADFLLKEALVYFNRNSVQTIDYSKESLTVAFPGEILTLSPFDSDFYGRQILSNVFDSLITLDRNLRPSPGLAISYGLIDENTWNFVLKKGVVFHDGSVFNYDDIEKTFELALKNSSFSDLLGDIDSLEKISDLEFNIHTKYFDPLLLHKLSMIYIVSDDYSLENKLIGTGPFVYDKQDENEYYLYPNLNYWCAVPKIKEYKIIFENDAIKRMDLLLENKVDLLAFVPHSSLLAVQQYGFNTISLPSLEVQFLLFNFDSKFFKDVNFRKIFASIINRQEIIKLIGAKLLASKQFISSGVFGFNSDIDFKPFTEEQIASFLSSSDVDMNVNFVLPVELELLGNEIKSQFSKFGININLQFSDNVLEDLAQSDFFFMTYKSDLGDFSQFLTSVVKSDAKLNFFNFSDELLDKRIDNTLNNTDVLERLDELKDINKYLIEDAIIGVPLFEYETYYAFSDKIDFIPRLDGIIFFDDIKLK